MVNVAYVSLLNNNIMYDGGLFVQRPAPSLTRLDFNVEKLLLRSASFKPYTSENWHARFN
jgi:hypothetical protein